MATLLLLKICLPLMLCVLVSNALSQSCTLSPSGPIVVSQNNQVIQHLYIRSLQGLPAITVKGFTDVVISNVLIEHSELGPGISFSNADGLMITNVSISLVTKIKTGPLPTTNAVSIAGQATNRLRIDHVRASGGSSGIYLLACAAAHLTFIEGHNMRGPFPRGQCVQFDKSSNSILEDFSCVNDIGQNVSYTEDNLSVYQSDNVTLRRGLIDGNNSPTGDGVMVETGGVCRC